MIEVSERAINESGQDIVTSKSSFVPAKLSSNPKDVAAKAKCPVHLVPPCLIRAVAAALANGAAKYGEFNWRSDPVQLRNYAAAIMRHAMQVLDGEDCDAESGLSHVAHIAATCAIILDAANHGTLIDDRPKGRADGKVSPSADSTAGEVSGSVSGPGETCKAAGSMAASLR